MDDIYTEFREKEKNTQGALLETMLQITNKGKRATKQYHAVRLALLA